MKRLEPQRHEGHKGIRLGVLGVFVVIMYQGFIQPAPWSERIASSFMTMHPDSIVYEDEAKSRKWNYEQGLMLEAFYQMWKHTNDSMYFRYVKTNLDHYIADNGEILTYKVSEYNIDNIAPGKVVVRMYGHTGDERYRTAAELLMKQLQTHPRTNSGGFWHKKIYPNQMWLDGLYMGEPFYAIFAQTFGEKHAFDDIAHQFLLIRDNNKDPKSGLYFHGWDESREQKWADPKTGLSPNLWGRSIGWLAMALVDVLEIFPAEHPKRPELLAMFADLSERAWQARERSSNLWYQIIDKKEQRGNYLEASVSTMLTYAMARGVNLGFLPDEFGARAVLSFEGILKEFVTTDEGVVSLHSVVKVGGLGGNPYRDGSFEYYISEPLRTNDFKGYGPLLLAAIEVEKLNTKESAQ